MNEWSVVYERAIREDGSLFFPERLSKEFLASARKTQGSYFFANQYQNEIIPEEERRFRPEWLRYYETIPRDAIRFGFIDPAISQNKHSDYTGIVIVSVDTEGHWYLQMARRSRMTPTEIINSMFSIQNIYPMSCIGIETVAYQEALLYMLDTEMKKRNVMLPVKGIGRQAISKATRILALVPRFEWGRISIARGLVDFEDEYAQFPRGTHDDLLDALSSIEEIAHTPKKEEVYLVKPNSPADPNYERWYIQELSRGRKPTGSHEAGIESGD